jgi:hypothetical protein
MRRASEVGVVWEMGLGREVGGVVIAFDLGDMSTCMHVVSDDKREHLSAKAWLGSMCSDLLLHNSTQTAVSLVDLVGIPFRSVSTVTYLSVSSLLSSRPCWSASTIFSSYAL